MEEKLTVFKTVTDGLFRKGLAIMILYFLLSFLLDIGMKAFEKEKWDLVLMVMTLAINTVTLLFAFYFATSQGSVDKSKQIDKLINGGGPE